MANISLRTLGAVTIEVGRRSIGPSTGQLFALLFYLCCRRGQLVPRALLQELFFPHSSEQQTAHSLRQLLYRARKLGMTLETDGDAIQIAGEVWIDWLDILERGELGNPDMELIAQGLFPGFNPDVSEGYREWFEGERSAVRLRLSRAVGLQLTQLRRACRWELVDAAARAMLTLDPLSEEGALARADALAASGSKVEAIRVIDAYLEELGDDQANLKLTPLALRRRISERLPEMGHRAHEERIFVGREDAMRMLSAAGAAARSGTQQTVLVWGEPGMGKTRLLTEYKALACLQGALAFQLSCQPHDVFRPLGILSDLVGQLLQAPGALGCDPDRRILLTRIVGVSCSASTLEHHRGEASLSQIVQALDDLLSAIASEASLLVLLDDAQWVDRSSLKAILAACSARVARRVCLVLASRERTLLLGSEAIADDVTSIRLNPLENGAARELVRCALRAYQGSSLAASEEQIVAQGRGNPFILRLLCKHLSATGEPMAIQQTVGEILTGRLEHLSPAAVRTLEAAVVLGKNCTLGRLSRALQVSRLELLRSIEELDDHGLIELRDGCFVVSHALLVAPVVSRMSPSVGRALHAAAAEILQEDTAGGSTVWDCAEHWRCAEDHLKALAVLRGCAERSIAAGRPSDALAAYKRALVLEVPEAVRCELLEKAIFTVAAGIAWQEALSLVPELRSLRSRLGRPCAVHDQVEIIEFAARLHGGVDPRIDVPRLRACVGAEGASPQHRLAAARQLLMVAEMTIDPDSAELAYSSTRGLAPGTLQQMLCDLLYHIWFGDMALASYLADELAFNSLKGDSSGGRPENISYLLNAGYAQSRIGSRSAEDTLLRGLTLAKESGAQRGAMHAYLFLAEHCWRNGRYGECGPWLKRFAEVLPEYPDFDPRWEYDLVSARFAIREGRLDDATHSLVMAKQYAQSRIELPRLLIGACEIELRLARGDSPCTWTELSELTELYARARGVGRQDEPTAAIAASLRYYERADEAAFLVQDYLKKYRRERYSLRPEFLEAFRTNGSSESSL